MVNGYCTYKDAHSLFACIEFNIWFINNLLLLMFWSSQILANQPPESKSLVTIQLSDLGSFATSSLDISILETQVLAWRTSIVSLQGMSPHLFEWSISKCVLFIGLSKQTVSSPVLLALLTQLDMIAKFNFVTVSYFCVKLILIFFFGGWRNAAMGINIWFNC